MKAKKEKFQKCGSFFCEATNVVLSEEFSRTLFVFSFNFQKVWKCIVLVVFFVFPQKAYNGLPSKKERSSSPEKEKDKRKLSLATASERTVEVALQLTSPRQKQKKKRTNTS